MRTDTANDPHDSLPEPDSAPTPDQAAAHQFLSELRTRIATQPLPYQFGVESRALESLWALFELARDTMKENPGCEKFAAKVSDVLNRDLRPVTAKWHRGYLRGLLNSQDGAWEFRRDFEAVQRKLVEFEESLHLMAYGAKMPKEKAPPAIDEKRLEEFFLPLKYGIPPDARVSPEDRQAINKAESAEVHARRKRLERPPETYETDAVGLALSGGGIRSATFCLGVVQVLAEKGLLRDVDFLSTVSGGGYTGSFLSQRLGNATRETDLAKPYGPDTEPIRYLRQNAKYLAARSLQKGWSMATATLAGTIMNWMAPLLVVVLAAITALLISRLDKWVGSAWETGFYFSAGASVGALYFYGGMMRGSARMAAFGGWLVAACLALTLGMAAAWALGAGYPAFPEWLHSVWDERGKTLLLLGGMITAGPTFIRFLPVLKNPAVRKITLRVLLILAGLIVPFMGLTAFYVCWWIGDRGLSANVPGEWALMAVAVLLIIFDLMLLDINLTAPHRLYRDALANTFIFTGDNDRKSVPLSALNPSAGAPCHLLNATLNIPSTQHTAVRDRLCDFFLFSKHFMGSPATGYRPTGKWQVNADQVDLATAMAVSGAAFSSYMGLGSFPTLTALLTFLNLRLGFWIRHPDRPGGIFGPHPGFFCLLREMFRFGMSEKNRWLNLSDGGHIENLAVYELLRRRCKFIISVDGEADPAYEFPGLMTLIRHAQIDFGVRIEPLLDGLRPDAGSKLSQSHAHFCRIHYPEKGEAPAGTGFLLYLKLSVTGNETELIHQYRERNPEFPHQTTLDQFFDEEQFEAYRELGVHVAEGMLTKPFWEGSSQAAGVAGWFRNLAAHLLPANAD